MADSSFPNSKVKVRHLTTKREMNVATSKITMSNAYNIEIVVK